MQTAASSSCASLISFLALLAMTGTGEESVLAFLSSCYSDSSLLSSPSCYCSALLLLCCSLLSSESLNSPSEVTFKTVHLQTSPAAVVGLFSTAAFAAMMVRAVKATFTQIGCAQWDLLLNLINTQNNIASTVGCHAHTALDSVQYAT